MTSAHPRGRKALCTEISGRSRVVKPSWGTKRTCQNCAARFYDLNKSPIKCPKCGREHDREDFVKVRRGRTAPAWAERVGLRESPRRPRGAGDGGHGCRCGGGRQAGAAEEQESGGCRARRG